MMKILFENEWRIMMNTIRTQPSRNLFAYLISVIVIGLFLIFISNGVWYLAGKMTTPIFEGILSYSLLMVIGITVLFGLPYVYKNLYASTDLELLFTMPIPTPYIFWIKYIQSFRVWLYQYSSFLVCWLRCTVWQLVFIFFIIQFYCSC